MRNRRLLWLLFLYAVSGAVLYPATSPQDIRQSARDRLKNNATDFRGLFNLGYASYLLGDYDAALKQFQNALPHAGGREERSIVRYNIGNAYFMKQKFKEALQQYRIGLRLNPEDRELQYNYTVARMLRQAQQQNKNQNKNDPKNKKGSPDKKQDGKSGAGKDNQDKKQPAAGKKQRISKEDARRILEALRQGEGKRMKARQLKGDTGKYNPNSKEW